jgi:ATP-dependent RNA helicase RhlE
MTFAELRLNASLLRAITEEGYQTPTPIQEQAIPHVLSGEDILGCAQTGTGKTAAFALPILHRMLEQGRPEGQGGQGGQGGRESRRPIRCLVLAPTRELAAQIEASFLAYSRHTDLRCTVIYGGVRQRSQVAALQKGVDVLIATPGRLLDLMGQRYVDLRHVEYLVLDEADHMLDMGFIDDVRDIISYVPRNRQTLFFSATMPPEIQHLADTILKSPVEVKVAPTATTVDAVNQLVYHVERLQKPHMLLHFIQEIGKNGRVLVFTKTKAGADRVAKTLDRAGIRAEAMHGDLNQRERDRAMEHFKSERPPVLVATDIAARGLDIDEISHVVNYDVPLEPETYVHRIGRTARAGATGIAVTFSDIQERTIIRDIEKLIRKPIPIAPVPPTVPTLGQLLRGDDRPRPVLAGVTPAGAAVGSATTATAVMTAEGSATTAVSVAPSFPQTEMKFMGFRHPKKAKRRR